MSKTIWAIIILVVVGTGTLLYFSNTPSVGSNYNQVNNIKTPETPVAQSGATATGGEPAGAGVGTAAKVVTVKEFRVVGQSYSFSPATLAVNKGDRVKITFKDDDGFHDLRINGYEVGTERVNTGGEAIVEFTADKTGSFEYYCSVGNHREKGMVGTLTVNP